MVLNKRILFHFVQTNDNGKRHQVYQQHHTRAEDMPEGKKILIIQRGPFLTLISKEERPGKGRQQSQNPLKFYSTDVSLDLEQVEASYSMAKSKYDKIVNNRKTKFLL